MTNDKYLYKYVTDEASIEWTTCSTCDEAFCILCYESKGGICNFCISLKEIKDTTYKREMAIKQKTDAKRSELQNLEDSVQSYLGYRDNLQMVIANYLLLLFLLISFVLCKFVKMIKGMISIIIVRLIV